MSPTRIAVGIICDDWPCQRVWLYKEELLHHYKMGQVRVFLLVAVIRLPVGHSWQCSSSVQCQVWNLGLLHAKCADLNWWNAFWSFSLGSQSNRVMIVHQPHGILPPWASSTQHLEQCSPAVLFEGEQGAAISGSQGLFLALLLGDCAWWALCRVSEVEPGLAAYKVNTTHCIMTTVYLLTFKLFIYYFCHILLCSGRILSLCSGITTADSGDHMGCWW